ncbi:hypothetical protein [uncultured Ramlibacter sp.]|uniref:hypothetical protein n=1 Tax=uncultured Ramlibacter sp. TaxID=260755 RepID=UPI0026100495|nr:hypothetical protein [uncultured Ramlibacter sp.]
MKHHPFALTVLVAALCGAALPAHAAPAAGQVEQLSGFVLAARAGGAVKVLAARSTVEQGDTLSTEPATYMRVALAGGGEALLGPDTRLRLQAGKLVLLQGQVRMTAAPGVPLELEAGDNRLTATAATFDVSFVPDPGAAVAQRAYARAAMAALAGPVTDVATEAALWQVAQLVAPSPGPGFRPSGLHVFVQDGMLNLTNQAGSMSFNAGQFGYTPSPIRLPVIVPINPFVMLTLPPTFTATGGSSPNTGTGIGNKSSAVDCEVR